MTKKTKILSIDPGQRGAICLRTLEDDEEKIELFRLADSYFLASLLLKTGLKNLIAVVEKAQAMPKNGAVAMFNYGTGFGEILGVLSALSVPFSLVRPNVWTKELHKGIDQRLSPKEKSLLVAKRLFPNVDLLASEKCRKPDEGFVDAILLNEYARRHLV